jgi:hypothetical protein
MYTLGADQYVWYFSFYDTFYHKLLLKNRRTIFTIEIIILSNKCRNIFLVIVYTPIRVEIIFINYKNLCKLN